MADLFSWRPSEVQSGSQPGSGAEDAWSDYGRPTPGAAIPIIVPVPTMVVARPRMAASLPPLVVTPPPPPAPPAVTREVAPPPSLAKVDLPKIEWPKIEA